MVTKVMVRLDFGRTIGFLGGSLASMYYFKPIKGRTIKQWS
jgi:hypothetical protein